MRRRSESGIGDRLFRPLELLAGPLRVEAELGNEPYQHTKAAVRVRTPTLIKPTRKYKIKFGRDKERRDSHVTTAIVASCYSREKSVSKNGRKVVANLR
jgi:hypothetical protein